MPKSDTSARLVASPIWKYGLAVLSVAISTSVTLLLRSSVLIITPVFSSWSALRRRTEDALAKALEMTPTGA